MSHSPFRRHLVGLATCYYRKAKTYFLTEKPPLLTDLFFRAVGMLDRVLSGRKIDPANEAAIPLWKLEYHQYYAKHPEERWSLDTEFPVAYASDDHKHPRGTAFDNSSNPRFNAGVYRLLGFPEQLRMMDLGCAGGALVKSFLADGHQAIGVEGSDLSRRLRSGEWDTIPFHLFTGDITKPFTVRDTVGNPVQFDVITAWEVLEHIPAAILSGLLRNIFNHLKPGGRFFCSIDLLPDGNPLTGAIYHQTLESPSWWVAQFEKEGFVQDENHGLITEDMVRGNGLSLKDWRPEDGGGTHLVMQKPATPPVVSPR